MGFLYSQLCVTPPVPTQSFAGQTVIVTGSNVGLGMEAARHTVRLNAKKVVLAVRNLKAGEEAKKNIEESTGRSGVCEVMKLDLGNFESVKEFAKNASKLERVDVLLENAGIVTPTFKLVEGGESTITVNVISTFLLAFLMMPKLEETARKFDTRPRLTIVASEVHGFAKFGERNASNILATLNNEKTSTMADRYNVSKLLEVLVVREIAPIMAKGRSKDVILNMLNPGLCHSALGRDSGWGLWFVKLLLARITEVGSRTLVHSAAAGPESHGQYMTDTKVDDDAVIPWVRGEEGKRMSKKVWVEIKARLEEIEPGVTKNIE